MSTSYAVRRMLFRGLAFALAFILGFAMLPVSASALGYASSSSKSNQTSEDIGFSAHVAAPSNILRKSGDLSEYDTDDWPDLGFWSQSGLKRSDVKRIEFHNTTAGAPRKKLMNLAANNDFSIIGWHANGILHVAANGTIYLNEDCSYLFAGFTNLQEIAFNGCVDTSLVKDMHHMFAFCKNLEELDVSFFDTSNVERMDTMFYQCKSLEELDVSDFDTSEVEHIARMFSYCENLKKLDVNSFDTGKVKDFSQMFYCCKSLTELKISNLDTSSAVLMNGMFYHCEKLKTLDISNFNTSNVQAINHMFSGCKSLTELDFRNFDTSNVTSSEGFLDDNWVINGRPWKEMI